MSSSRRWSSVLCEATWTSTTWPRGGSRGDPGPLFLAKSVYFLHCIQWKNIFEIEFWFYSGRNPSFWKCGGVCARVCVSVWSHRPTRQISRFYVISVGFEIVAATVFCSAKPCKGPILNDIRGHSDPQNICQIAGNRIYFLNNFLGEAPRPPPALAPSALGSGLRSPYRAPSFQNSWIRPCDLTWPVEEAR